MAPPGQIINELVFQISQHEFNSLALIARQYANLRRNLLLGGVDEATLDTLSADEPGSDELSLQPQPVNTTHSEKLNNKAQAKSNSYTGENNTASTSSSTSQKSQYHTSAPPLSSSSFVDECDLDDAEDVGEDGGGAAAAYDRKCLRTLQLVSLPESATLADVAAAVRGGLLLELFIRPHDRSAFVSFAREPDAKAYFEHVKRHDLYIKNKRINVVWSQRQHTMLPHIGQRVNTGATRNLVIRQCHPKLTEASIREDLSHIHNLVVVSVAFGPGDEGHGKNCYINLNSVHNALFARSCMMSRAVYRTSRIDWMPDECAQLLERIAAPVRQKKPKKNIVARSNASFGVKSRFQLLNLDDGSTTKDSAADEDDDNDN
ncbi:hypothetical protein Sste5344_005241 [Sporothrix stenoceras]